MSRRCCCDENCQNLWLNSARLHIISPTKSEFQLQTIAGPGYTFSAAGDFDAYHQINYVGAVKNSPVTMRIISKNEVNGVQADVLTKGITSVQGFNFSGVTVAPRINLLSYIIKNFSTNIHTVYQVNMDGTGDTSLFNVPQLTNEFNQNNESDLNLTRSVYNQHLNQFCFSMAHTRSAPLRTTRRLYVFAPGAGAPTVIYDQSDADSGGLRGTIRILDYDGLRAKYWFAESRYNGTAIERLIKRCDPDGSNVETVVNYGTSTTNSKIYHLETSYSRKSYITWESKGGTQALDAEGGLFERDYDLNEKTRFVTRATFDRDFSTLIGFSFALGCGFEKVGPTYKGY